MITEENSTRAGVSRWRWWVHLILIGGYIIPPIPLALWHVRNQPALSSSPTGLLFVCGVEIVIFAVVFGLGWLTSRASTEQLLFTWRPRWWVIPLGIGYSVAIRIGVGIAFLAILLVLIGTGALPRESVPEFIAGSRPAVERLVDVSAMQHSSAYFWLVVTLSSFVVAGLREEMWRAGTLAAMRVLWPNTFGERDGQLAAVTLIAMVFGLAHLSLGLVSAAMASVLGFFLGIIMVVHRSIWSAVIAHGMFDATSFALLPLAEHLRPIH